MAKKGKVGKKQHRLTDQQKWVRTMRINTRKDKRVERSSHGKFKTRAEMVVAGGGRAMMDEKTMRWTFMAA